MRVSEEELIVYETECRHVAVQRDKQAITLQVPSLPYK